MMAGVTGAAEEIRAAIGADGGAIGFDRFMQLALYGEFGFYTRDDGGAAGRRGDFITSPEVGPLFGLVLARMLDAEWVRLGRPATFSVIEIGAGPGTLARAILSAAPECSRTLEYTAVEVSARQRERHPEDVRSAAALDDVIGGGPLTGVVIANEVLDNVPFRLAVHDGGWREALVVGGDEGGGERFAEVLSAPLAPVPPVLPAVASHGARAPLQQRAGELVAAMRAVLDAGSVLVLDYCRPTTAELVALPWRKWLRTYRGHQRSGHYLADPGLHDITTDVALDQLPPADAVRRQAQFLGRWGVDALVEEGRRYWEAHATQADLAALRMRSRVAEAEALVDPAGLGGFTVLEYRV
jgi:SAM-dependent MidA family methyltransferase